MKSKIFKKINLKNLLAFLAQIIFFALILFFLFISLLSRSQGAFGLRSFVVSTGSMGKTLPASTFVVTKSQPSYQIGDIITFYTNDINGNRQRYPTTHRLIEIEDGQNLGYLTKGDANNTDDGFITPAKSVIGKVVFKIPYFGYITNFINSRNGRIFLILLPAVAISYHQLYLLILDIKKLKSKKPFSLKEKYPNVFPILIFFLLLFPTPVKAFFDDQENVTDSQISTSILDMLVTLENPFTAIVQSCQSQIKVENLNSIEAFEYSITATKTAGTNLCLESRLVISIGDTIVFDDSISNLYAFIDPNLLVTNSQTLSFTLTPPQSADPQTCSFDFTFFAWHQGLLPDQSFTDIETISDNFSIVSSTLETNITLTQFRHTDPTLDITYDSSGASRVNLCYSFNLNPWLCDDDYTDYPNSPGEISFDFPQGNGVYYFITFGYNSLNQKEDKPLPDPLLVNPLDPSIHALIKDNPDIDIELTNDPSINSVDILFSLIPEEFGQDSPDFLEYEVIYQTPNGQKGGAGSILPANVSPSFTYQSDSFYLGTCTSPGENCTPDVVVDNKINIILSGRINSKIIYINKYFDI